MVTVAEVKAITGKAEIKAEPLNLHVLKRILFIDRDGTLINEAPPYVSVRFF